MRMKGSSMQVRFRAISLIVFLMSMTALVGASEPIRLADNPALSPDGSTLAFAWRGDIWTVSSDGGAAVQLTQHPASDSQPVFSPDGSEIAFISDRDTGNQVYVVSIEGGTPKQLTFHTAGYSIEGWYPSGQSLLVSGSRDHFWRSPSRFFRISRDERRADELLFDAAGADGELSPDGKRLLFVRGGRRWWRKGYRGSASSQIWMYDLETKQYEQLIKRQSNASWPLWQADGSGFYYVGDQSGAFNLWQYDLDTGNERQLTFFEDDSVVFPCISRDGSTIIFRHLFDLYRFKPGSNVPPTRIEIINTGDAIESPTDRKTVNSATDVAFSDDALEIAFIAGGDLWVMDTELKEPHQITATPEEERDPIFSPDGKAIYFVSDKEGQCDIWRATRSDEDLYWWQNETFDLKRLTHDSAIESDIRFSPDQSRLSFIKGAGDLWTVTPEGKEATCVIASWNELDYDWSPDGKWIVYAVDDNDFNRDIWIIPSDGSDDPINVSRHPYDEYSPVWRPDGKVIAFTGERLDREVDIFYLWLEDIENQKSHRDRTLEEAVKKMEKKRKKDEPKAEPKEDENKAEAIDESSEEESDEPKEEKESEDKKDLPEVKIDFDKIHERIRRIGIGGSSERGLLWSPDSKKLAFIATVDGKRGTYTVEFPDELNPKLLTSDTGSSARWIKEGNQIVWLSGGKPASVTDKGKETSYSFSCKQEMDRAAHFAAAFDLAWRAMRDNYYDERLGNRNWDAIRRKYAEAATHAPDVQAFATVVNLMLGELNGSHLGFYPRGGSNIDRPDWNVTTAHLGVRFDRQYKGPGLKIRDVLPDGPADREVSKLEAGEIITSIDGVSVDPEMDLTEVLNGPSDRDMELSVRDANDQSRQVTIRPTSYGAVRSMLYEKWIDDNQRMVEKLSDGKLGYVHIQSMNWSSFQRLERELYAVGVGKDGLIIDVRNNGGGFTADHVLTVLCQPSHAITVPRGGGKGYPQDRRVYANWNKPIVMMCNQNSFSNAEIISHAVKTLKRGKLVGVPTAGGVISTGGTNIMDVGFLRLPFRGWFILPTGEDMELNGAVPDYIIWPEPGEMPAGIDKQLEKAVDVLLDDVGAWKAKPRPTLRKATERE